MSTRTDGRSLVPASVRRLGDRIELWRRTRARRTAMPAELWRKAVELSRRHGVYRVARALRLNFEGLKRRLAEASAPSVPGEASAPVGGEGFVALSAAQLLGVSTAGGTTVEVSDGSGARLTVRLGGDVALDVAGIVAAFVRDAR